MFYMSFFQYMYMLICFVITLTKADNGRKCLALLMFFSLSVCMHARTHACVSVCTAKPSFAINQMPGFHFKLINIIS